MLNAKAGPETFDMEKSTTYAATSTKKHGMDITEDVPKLREPFLSRIQEDDGPPPLTATSATNSSNQTDDHLSANAAVSVSSNVHEKRQAIAESNRRSRERRKMRLDNNLNNNQTDDHQSTDVAASDCSNAHEKRQAIAECNRRSRERRRMRRDEELNNKDDLHDEGLPSSIPLRAGDNGGTDIAPLTLLHGQYDEMKVEEEEVSSHANEDEYQKPGAFAVGGIGVGDPSYAWQSMFEISEIQDSTENENNENNDQVHLSNEDMIRGSDQQVSNGSENLISAVVVDDDAIPEAEAVSEETLKRIGETKDKYRKYAWITFAIAMLAITISIISWLFMKDDNSTDFSQVPSVSASMSPSLSPTTTPLPTLQTITDRDELRCAVSGNYEIEQTICKAIAAAVLGNANKTKKVIVDASNPYVALSNMEADVATTFSKFAMDKDVYQKDTQVGFTFTDPWFYDGYAFGGDQEYVQCAVNFNGFFHECNKLRICVHADEAYDAVREWFPASMIKMVPFESFYQSFKDGKCNVLSGLSIEISQAVVREKINSEDYHSNGELWLSRETTAAVTTEVDAEWSNFVKWVIQALFAAEARNITRANADSFTTTNVFGEQYQNMFRNAIKAVGNYGTILEEDPLTSLVPRPSIQEQNDGSTGLIYSFPFGEHSNIVGPEPAEGSVMKNILDRGFIRCGVIIEKDTTDWRLLGKEYCRALSASLFHGNASKVEFINMNSTIDGYVSLDRAELDLLSGARVTLEADTKEPTTGKGFAFSLPYYYEDPQGESLQEGEFISGTSIGLVTREDDYPWSNFVFWMVPATFYAEEKGITKNLADEMPSINLFGSSLEDMYRHAIGAVGNYAEMYQKKWGDGLSIMTRLGRNQLNRNPYGPQVKPMFSNSSRIVSQNGNPKLSSNSAHGSSRHPNVARAALAGMKLSSFLLPPSSFEPSSLSIGNVEPHPKQKPKKQLATKIASIHAVYIIE